MSDDERWPGDADQYPEGPIEPGMLFLWEPYLPRSMSLVRVVETSRNADGELWIYTARIMDHPDNPTRADRCWNDESRFREAAARVMTLGVGPLALAAGDDTPTV